MFNEASENDTNSVFSTEYHGLAHIISCVIFLSVRFAASKSSTLNIVCRCYIYDPLKDVANDTPDPRHTSSPALLWYDARSSVLHFAFVSTVLPELLIVGSMLAAYSIILKTMSPMPPLVMVHPLNLTWSDITVLLMVASSDN